MSTTTSAPGQTGAVRDRAKWDDMTDEEWEAFEQQMYEEQLEELKQTLRVTTPFVARQIGVMMGVSLCRWMLGSFFGIHYMPIPNVAIEAKNHIISERFRKTIHARQVVFDGERSGFTNLD